jgi:glycosyltransferase involved in cell wall biosynthesis
MIRLWAVGPNNHLENQNYTENSIDLIGTTTQHIPNAVKYWGRIDDREELAMILASSDVFVFPSRREGFGLAPVEAMACGVPAIISRIPGVTDLVSVEGETGRYVEVNDAKSLQAAMKELAVNPELRTIMGKAASQRVQKYFGWENHIGKWEALYQSLL